MTIKFPIRYHLVSTQYEFNCTKYTCTHIHTCTCNQIIIITCTCTYTTIHVQYM